MSVTLELAHGPAWSCLRLQRNYIRLGGTRDTGRTVHFTVCGKFCEFCGKFCEFSGKIRYPHTEAGVYRGERTTHLQARADDRDSEPDHLLRPTRHGPGGTLLDLNCGSFDHWLLEELGTIGFESALQRQLLS